MLRLPALLLCAGLLVSVPANRAQAQTTPMGATSFGQTAPMYSPPMYSPPSGRSPSSSSSLPIAVAPLRPGGQASGGGWTTTNPSSNEYGTTVPGVTTR